MVMTGDLVPVNEYWERWTVGADTPGVFTPNYDHAVRHYKCWVLMAIPRDRVDSRVRATLAAAQSRLAETSARLAVVEAENAACQAEKNCGRVISVRGR